MVKALITLLVACAVTGCSTGGTARGGNGGVDRGAIQVLIKADPQLNRFDRNPHALVLCLYQLKDPDAFRQLAKEKAGTVKLLQCSHFDETVVSAAQVVVQPGQELRQVRNRGEGTRYLGIATGYYSLGKKRVTELSPLPREGAAEGAVVRIDLGAQEIGSVRGE